MGSWIFTPCITQAQLDQQAFSLGYAGGWRLQSIALFGAFDDPRYATLWVAQNNAPSFSVQSDLHTSESLHQRIQEQKAYDLVPVLLSATGEPHFQRYVVHFEMAAQPPPGDVLPWGDSPWDEFHAYSAGPDSDAPFHYLKCFDAWPGKGGMRCCALLYRRGVPPEHGGLHRTELGVMGAVSSTSHRVLNEGWNHIEMAVPLGVKENDLQDVVSYWRSDRVFEPWPDDMLDPSYTGGTTMLGPMRVDQAEAWVSYMEAAGWRPMHVGANGVGEAASMCITFSRRLLPLLKNVVVYDPASPPPFDKVPKPLIKTVPRHGPLFSATPAEAQIMPGSPSFGLGSLGNAERRRPKRPSGRINPKKGILYAGGSPQYGDAAEYGAPPHHGGLGLNASVIIETLEEGLAQIDEILLDTLIETNARGIQLAAGIDGRLPLLRCMTRAEEGYPVLTPDHLMRPGSISKALTAAAVVRLLATGADIDEAREKLRTTLPNAFEFPPVEPTYAARNVTTIDHLLYHHSGWATEEDVSGIIDGTDYQGAHWYEAACIAVHEGGPNYAEPGDMREFIAHWPTSFHFTTPGSVADYHGMTYRALGELVGRLQTTRWDRYDLGMRLLWGMGDDEFPDPRVGYVSSDRGKSIENDHYPCHNEGPGIGYDKAGKVLVPHQYAGNHEWGGGSGAWCMSMKTLARILHGMGLSERAPQLISALQRDLLAEQWSGVGMGRGWLVDEVTETWWEKEEQTAANIKHALPWEVLWHNGSTSGGAAVALFYYRGSGKTTSVALSVNLGDGTGAIAALLREKADELWKVVRRMYRGFGLPGDLFDEE